MKYAKQLSLVLFGLIVLASCKKISKDSTVTVRNTFEDVSQPEIAYSLFFGLAEDALDVKATISNDDIEFPEALKVKTHFGIQTLEYWKKEHSTDTILLLMNLIKLMVSKVQMMPLT
ncbi:hypothetical protein DNU06_11735 [Putridiphycobacter roseus]|uniref:Uncharacterized protein n=1 Tax=Putridiphycobacter roseus TaxID=2219161 RepID=A0A2W1NLI3_9FLAO|nr:hypothetical protein [Putridiphycobacter roseus]PZE16522.1 hypothetical protein DNU06_11735 [Putridiphycobacter roseus]